MTGAKWHVWLDDDKEELARVYDSIVRRGKMFQLSKMKRENASED